MIDHHITGREERLMMNPSDLFEELAHHQSLVHGVYRIIGIQTVGESSEDPVLQSPSPPVQWQDEIATSSFIWWSVVCGLWSGH